MTIADSPPPIEPFQFFDLRVLQTRRLSRSLIRVTFGGNDLQGLASGGYDQSFSIFLPHPQQDTPVVPTGEGWFAAWQALPEAERALRRSYTIREQRYGPDEIDVDFALHAGDNIGPATRWALRAAPGNRVKIQGPALADNVGVSFRLPPKTDWVLLFADETALPAAAAILERLPPGLKTRVWIEVPHLEDRITLTTSAESEIAWTVRENESPEQTERALKPIRAAELPEGTPYAWIAGEAHTIRTLRRHLVHERGIDRRAVAFSGYWRLGLDSEQLLTQLSVQVPDD